MKSLFLKARLITLTAVLLTGVFGASADTATIGRGVYRLYTVNNARFAELLGFAYAENGTEQSTDAGKILVQEFIIPDIVETEYTDRYGDHFMQHHVASVAPEAFKGQYLMKSLRIKSNITDITDNALGECTGLWKVMSTSTTLKVNSSGTALYRKDTAQPEKKLKHLLWISGGLEEFTIPADVSHVSSSAFASCSSEFASITLDPSNPYLAVKDGVIYNKDMTEIQACMPLVSEVIIPAGTKKLPDYFMNGAAFASVTKVVLPEGLEEIGKFAFAGCSQLKEISIPASVTAIGDYAFRGTGIESIVLPQYASQLGKGLFRDCKALKSVKLPLNTSVLPDETFYGCLALKSFTIPQNITTLGEKVFMNSNIEEVTMHDAVVAAGTSTFENTPNLQNVVLSASLARIPDRMFVNSGFSDIAIPSGTKEIGKFAFCDATRLVTINLGPTLNSIGEYAFAGTPLVSVTGGENLRTIGKSAFYRCRELKGISLPDCCKLSPWTFAESGLTSFRLPNANTIVPDYLLRDTPVTSIIISSSCYRLGEQCFYTPTLMQVYCNAAYCPTANVYEHSFHQDTFDYGTLTVPTGKKIDYYTDAFWGKFKNIEANDSGVEDVSGDEEGVQISVVGGELTVSGCANVEVFAANGLRVYAGTPGSIGSLPAGLYIVRAGGRTVKVRL